MSAQDKLIEYFTDKSDEEIIADINDHTDRMAELYSDIPNDKDCTQCPHSANGEWGGMVTPCFDICDDRPTRPFSMEEVHKAGCFIASIKIDDTGEPFE